MTWSVPSLSDGGDAAGDREVFFPVSGAGLDRGLDLVEAFLDGLGLADQLLGPGIVVEFREDALAGLQLLDLGLLFRRALGRLGINPPVAGGGVPVDLDHGPWPTSSGSRARPRRPAASPWRGCSAAPGRRTRPRCRRPSRRDRAAPCRRRPHTARRRRSARPPRSPEIRSSVSSRFTCHALGR